MVLIQLTVLIFALRSALVVSHGHTIISHGQQGIAPSSETHRHQDGHGNYDFGFSVHDGQSSQFRHETRDSQGKVTGTYGLAEIDGRKRVVDYVADHYGFRANVRTNEPGTSSVSAASTAVQKFATAPVAPDHSHLHGTHPVVNPVTKDVLHPSGTHSTSVSAVDHSQSKWGYHPAFGSRIPVVKDVGQPPARPRPVFQGPVYKGSASLPPQVPPSIRVPISPPGPIAPQGPISHQVPIAPQGPISHQVPIASHFPGSHQGPVSHQVPLGPHIQISPQGPISHQVPLRPYIPISSQGPVSPQIPISPPVPSGDSNIPIGKIPSPGVLPSPLPQDEDHSQRPIDPNQLINSLNNIARIPYHGQGQYYPPSNPTGSYSPGSVYNPGRPYDGSYSTNSLANPNQRPSVNQDGYSVNKPAIQGISFNPMNPGQYQYVTAQNNYANRPPFSGHPSLTGTRYSSNHPYHSNTGYSRPPFGGTQPVYPYHDPQGYPIKPSTYNKVPLGQTYSIPNSPVNPIKSPGRSNLYNNYPYHDFSNNPLGQIPGHHHYTTHGSPTENRIHPSQLGYPNRLPENRIDASQIPNTAESDLQSRPNVILRAVPIPNGIQAVPVDANTGEVLSDYPGFNVNNGHPIAGGNSNFYPPGDLSISGSTETKSVADPSDEDVEEEKE